MACLFIVDDDADNAQQLAGLLSERVAGAHVTVILQTLADYRRCRRQYTPDLILVELQRLQSNGFTLASALSRQSGAPVVLLTDRKLQSDAIWAAARGIRRSLSRCEGQQALINRINDCLRTMPDPQQLRSGHPETGAAADAIVPASESADNRTAGTRAALTDDAQIASWLTSPAVALLACIAGELQRLPATIKSNGLAWANSVLPYIDDPQICAGLSGLTAPRQSGQPNTSLSQRERLLLQLQPSAADALFEQCQYEWDALSRSLHTEQPAKPQLLHRCRQLLLILSRFRPVLAGGAYPCSISRGTAKSDDRRELTDLVKAIELALADVRKPRMSMRVEAQKILSETTAKTAARPGTNSAPELVSQLLHSTCVRVLACGNDAGEDMHAAGWRELARLALVLTTVESRMRWQPVALDCIAVLYDWQHKPPGQTRSHLIRLALGLMHRAADETADPSDTVIATLHLPPAVAEKLASVLTASEVMLVKMIDLISAPMTDRHPVSQRRLPALMVSIYKLRSWLQFSLTMPDDDVDAVRHWQLALGCLHASVCHGVRQTNVCCVHDLRSLVTLIRALQGCAIQCAAPPADLLLRLAALELTLHGRLHSGARDHALLAAGLHQLPQPETIVARLLGDVRQAGTLLSEITHELVLLADGASSLGVTRVESLARLMLDCYQQLGAQPELLQQKNVRLALGRAHRALCRLLDQAAAWLPLDEAGGGPALSAVIDALFTQFGYPCGNARSSAAAGGQTESEPGQAAWMQCQSLNRRLRQLLRQADDMSGYGSLMAELLNQQQAVIAPHLPYQSSR